MYHNFTVESITPVPDFNLTIYRLTHPTGAVFFHVARDDEDCAFSVTFRTPPTSSSGIAHILEHTTLCGSHRYPVRDPFFLLTRRSLKTYMNAMTAQDYTLYPFSTTHPQDYENLLRVYLDATFFPLLRPHDFSQEGHRLEFDAAGQLSIKGVVYNEMKGAMSDGGQLFTQRLQSAMFHHPANLYHWNSGGEPSDIPDLTYEQLTRIPPAPLPTSQRRILLVRPPPSTPPPRRRACTQPTPRLLLPTPATSLSTTRSPRPPSLSRST